jgi:hypothetical protein
MISGGSMDCMAFQQFKLLTYMFPSTCALGFKQVQRNGGNIDATKADTRTYRNDGSENF